MLKIREVIVVEGRDDTAAINMAVDAKTIETHGFGMNPSMWKEIDRAYAGPGIIIFTDPDRAGENIRKKIKERYPDCKEAFLSQTKALKKNDLGIENARAEDIIEALRKARCSEREDLEEFTMEDLRNAGLVNGSLSKIRREAFSDKLGIGYGNGKRLLKKLNGYGITREEFNGAVQSISNKENKK
ncbi:MAG: ribonuclease M5 [Hornefia sp.]|nr:ribonuclease M5 [Hornefia sp.]